MSQFQEALRAMEEIHSRKAADYALPGDEFSNFLQVARSLRKDVDEVILTFICTKIERLVNLKQTQADPMNESVEDTILDLAVYSTILLAWYEYNHATRPIQTGENWKIRGAP